MAFEKLYNEIYAVVLLKYFWAEYPEDFVKAESPDWVSASLDMGMEVSQALLQQDGEAQTFIERHLGTRKEDLPQSAWERYGDAMYFYNDRLWALISPNGEDREQGYGHRAVYRFQKKLEKLNRHYTPYADNALFLFLHTERPETEDIRQIAAQMVALQQQTARKFHYIFMDSRDTLYIADLLQGDVQEIPIPEGAQQFLKNETEQLRHSAEWPEGACFSEICRQVVSRQENLKKS